MTTAILNARIFDGEKLSSETSVIIDGEIISSVGGGIPDSVQAIDAHGGSLLPGLIDSHVHTDLNGLRDALLFGVTTELEMMGHWSKRTRKKINQKYDVADLRTAGMGITPPGGHPSQYLKSSGNLLLRLFYRFPYVSTREEAIKFIHKQVSEGADYIKIFIEDGSTVGFPGLTVPGDDILYTSVNEAHRLGKMAIAHITTVEGGKRAIDAGIDGLAHLFFDQKPSQDFILSIAKSGAFVVPTLVTLSSAFGFSASELASDSRVSSKLSKRWINSLKRNMNVYPQGNLEDAFASVMALKRAGVDILAGSDVSEPIPSLGGLAHGASLHHELQLLVKAGFTPVEALQAATTVPARRFGLGDRGRIAPGARADLILVDGDPLTNISDTLSIREVWRCGKRLKQANQGLNSL